MDYLLSDASSNDAIIELFTRVFSDSEGEDEGNSIGKLVSELVATTAPSELIGCIAKEQNSIVGCIFFSRLRVPSEQSAFLMSPVAIATEYQGKKIGQQLIHFGLEQLKSQNTELVVTYGDPAFYVKTGFQQVAEDVLPAPFPLSQPIGWLAQSLTGNAIPAMQGQTRCVDAFNDPSHW